MKKLIKNAIERYLKTQRRTIAMAFYKKSIQYNPDLGKYLVGEEQWLQRWRQYDPRLSPLAFRVFGRYIGSDMDIVPLEICTTLESVLTPYNFNNFYSDKNSFDLIFPRGVLPETCFRNIRGRLLDREYNIINSDVVDDLLRSEDIGQVVIKPGLGSSGRGVDFFYKRMGEYVNGDGDKLSIEYLNRHYKENYIIQKAFSQHQFFASLNQTSVNTIRIATYRDDNGIVHPLNSIIRIGSKGSKVDNAHAGGCFIGVKEDGKLQKYACDQEGRIQTNFNDVNFEASDFDVPNWENIKSFVCGLHRYVLHHDLVAWDVALDEHSQPYILELNVGGYGGWVFQFTSGPMFGRYTDDIIKSATKRLSNTQLKAFLIRK